MEYSLSAIYSTESFRMHCPFDLAQINVIATCGEQKPVEKNHEEGCS